MEFFWDTEYTIPAGQGFSPFSPGHLLWLAAALSLCLGLCHAFRHWNPPACLNCLRTIAGLLLAAEGFKYGVVLHSGEFHLSFLPLHLCSIHIFVIAADALRPSSLLREELFAVCMPGAFFALVFPGWTYLPLGNALCVHSFFAHILLLLYPLLVLAGGFQPQFKRFVHTLPALLVVVIAVYGFNRVFGTNFMFLSRAGEGNPLSWFESFLGSPGYLVGIPVIAGGCWGVLYGGRAEWRKWRARF